MIQATPKTREIGIQVNIAIPPLNHSATTFDDDDMWSNSELSDIEESVIEWKLLIRSDDGYHIPDTENDLSGDTKFIMYNSSLEHLLPTHCVNCGINVHKADYTWSILDIKYL